MDARAHQHALGGAQRQPLAQPVHAGSTVLARAAEILVAQQVVPVGLRHQLRRAVAQMGEQRRFLRFGRQVHRHFGGTAAAQRHARRRPADEGTHASARIDQPALACLGIAARHRRVIQFERISQVAQRRQPVARRQPSAAHVLGDEVGDQQIGRLVARPDALEPELRGLVHRGVQASRRLRVIRSAMRAPSAQRRTRHQCANSALSSRAASSSTRTVSPGSMLP